MKRKIAILGVFIICASLFLTGGKPKLISEEEAKKAGFAFINLAFDVNETEALVTYRTQAAMTYTDGEYKETGKEQPVNYYVVAASESKDGGYNYTAYVNAETGVAYSAEKSYSLVPEMTAEQRIKWSKAYANGDSDAIDYVSMDIDCTDFAREWIPQKFNLNASILGIVDSGSSFDQDGAGTNFYVVIHDGTIYHVTMAWPQLTVLEVTILNQTRPTGDLP